MYILLSKYIIKLKNDSKFIEYLLILVNLSILVNLLNISKFINN